MVLAGHPNICKCLEKIRVCINVCVNGRSEAPKNFDIETVWRAAPKNFFALHKA